jgi:undecaprenyl-diphosphatase
VSTTDTAIASVRQRWLTPLSRTATGAVVVLLAGFLGLAVLITLNWAPLISFDHAVVTAAHHDVLSDLALLSAAKIVTALGGDLGVNLVAGAVGLLLLLRRRVRAVIYLGVVRLVQVGLEETFKLVIARPRPTLPNPVAYSASFSFPSGHATGSAAVYGALLLLILNTTRHSVHPGRTAWAWTGGVAVVVLVAAVATSRVLLGVHYPSDVVAGILLGAPCCLAGRTILRPSDPAVAGVR